MNCGAAFNTLDYEFTVDDPATWTRPWSAGFPTITTEERIYEYACHEGNYGMMNILAGARAEERTQKRQTERRADKTQSSR